MAVKRGVLRPFRLDYWRPDRAEGEYNRKRYVIGDWLFLGLLFFLGAHRFPARVVPDRRARSDFEVWAPLGWAAGQGFRSLGLTGDAARSAHFAHWWVHGIAALGFVASIPFTKAVHMMTGPASGRHAGRHGRKAARRAPAGAKRRKSGTARRRSHLAHLVQPRRLHQVR